MNTRTYNIKRNRQLLGFALIAFALSMLYVCNKPDKMPEEVDMPIPPDVDALRASYDSAVKAHHVLDSGKMIEVAALKAERDKLKRDAATFQQSAQTWRKRYNEAMAAKDTPTAIVSCDSIMQSVEPVVASLTRQILKSDTIILRQAEQISRQQLLLTKAGSQVNVMDSAMRDVVKWNQQLSANIVSMEQKQRRAKKWNRVFIVAAAIGGVLIAK
jgi:hypothetical protein